MFGFEIRWNNRVMKYWPFKSFFDAECEMYDFIDKMDICPDYVKVFEV